MLTAEIYQMEVEAQQHRMDRLKQQVAEEKDAYDLFNASPLKLQVDFCNAYDQYLMMVPGRSKMSFLATVEKLWNQAQNMGIQIIAEGMAEINEIS